VLGADYAARFILYFDAGQNLIGKVLGLKRKGMQTGLKFSRRKPLKSFYKTGATANWYIGAGFALRAAQAI
jgi:hypothetical protein